MFNNRRSSFRISLPLKKPDFLKERLVIAIDKFEDEPKVHIVDQGQYLGDFSEDDAVSEILTLGYLEERARFFLAYARNFGCSAVDQISGEVIADNWDLSEIVPEDVWFNLESQWGSLLTRG